MPNLDSYRAILAGSVVFKAARPTASTWSSRARSRVFLPERAGSGAHRPSRIRLNRLGPGRCLGEYGVIDDQPSSASADALTPAKLCFLSKAEFRRLVERHDRLGRIVYANLLRYLVSRLRSKDKELDIFLLDEK